MSRETFIFWVFPQFALSFLFLLFVMKSIQAIIFAMSAYVGDIKSSVPLWLIATQPYVVLFTPPLLFLGGESGQCQRRKKYSYKTWLFQVTKKCSVRKELMREAFDFSHFFLFYPFLPSLKNFSCDCTFTI